MVSHKTYNSSDRTGSSNTSEDIQPLSIKAFIYVLYTKKFPGQLETMNDTSDIQKFPGQLETMNDTSDIQKFPRHKSMSHNTSDIQKFPGQLETMNDTSNVKFFQPGSEILRTAITRSAPRA
jgi:hypothetical protein